MGRVGNEASFALLLEGFHNIVQYVSGFCRTFECFLPVEFLAFSLTRLERVLLPVMLFWRVVR